MTMTSATIATAAVPEAHPFDPPTRLLAAVRAGEPDALGVLYSQYAARLLLVAQRITLHAHDAEDVVHDVFVGLPEALRHYAPRGKFSAWLVTCTVRMALMQRRTARRRRELAMDEAWPTGEAPHAASRPDLAPELAEVQQRLAALPAGFRAVVTLRTEGFTHAEIAETLGISEGNSRIRLARALEQLLAPLPHTSETSA